MSNTEYAAVSMLYMKCTVEPADYADVTLCLSHSKLKKQISIFDVEFESDRSVGQYVEFGSILSHDLPPNSYPEDPDVPHY